MISKLNFLLRNATECYIIAVEVAHIVTGNVYCDFIFAMFERCVRSWSPPQASVVISKTQKGETMSRIQVATRIDEDQSKQFFSITKALGTTPSDALRMFIAAFNSHGGFPYDMRIQTTGTQLDRAVGAIAPNTSVSAIRSAQKAFAGVAQSLGAPTEDEIQSWIDEVRYGTGETDESAG
jgi:antitoxin component of RelBE/YafQ-DinJ toxin-antitoxin module